MASSCYETDRHCRRVASFAGQVAERMGVDPFIRRALEDAALVHWKYRLPALRRNSGPDGPAGKILRVFAGAEDGAGEIRAAGHVLAVCEAFDESIEYALYEGRSLPEAITDFFDDCAAYPQAAVSALRELVWTERSRPRRETLPVLPHAAGSLLRISPETASPAELASIAETDPVLAAQLLGLANSAAHGSGAQIRSLREAVLRLGVPLAHKALLAASIGRLFVSARLRRLWTRSREMAAIAHELAPLCGCDPHLAWLAGLFHDIGRIIFETGPASRCAREAAWLRAGFPLTYAEMLVWGIDHADVGADLLQDWNVPGELVDAVRFHASPERSDSPLPGLLYLAESASGSREAEEPADLACDFRSASALAATGLRRSDLGSLGRESAVFALAS